MLLNYPAMYISRVLSERAPLPIPLQTTLELALPLVVTLVTIGS